MQQARPIENHIYLAKACLVGANGHEETPVGFGKSALYTPIDGGFLSNGIAIEMAEEKEGLIIGEIDIQKLTALKKNSSTSPFQDHQTTNINQLRVNHTCV
jgi:predicted amidohydrolase